MTVLIVDDELLARKGLRNSLLQAFDDVAGRGMYGRRRSASARRKSPQLVFLDIQMPGMNGFDAMDLLQGTACH